MSSKLLAAVFAILVWAAPACAADAPSIEVWKSATCQCCGKWVAHLEANGFAVKTNAADPKIGRAHV
jgi:hypothetical protein